MHVVPISEGSEVLGAAGSWLPRPLRCVLHPQALAARLLCCLESTQAWGPGALPRIR